MKTDRIDKEIIVTENLGVPRFGEFVRVGVPFAKGELHSTEVLSVLSPEQEVEPVQATPLNRWKDGSIKWLLLDFAATVPAMGRAAYRLVTDRGERLAPEPGIRITPGVETWQLDTGAAVFTVDAREFRPFARVCMGGREIVAEGSCTLLTADDRSLVPRVESIVAEAEGPLRAVLAVRGSFARDGKELSRFSSRLHFFAGSSCVQIELTIHNPHPALHRGGLWDLGDVGSFLFKEFALGISFPAGSVREIHCSPEQGSVPVDCAADGSLSLYQESSGGENWLSPVHRTRDGRVPFTLRGYEIRSGEKQVVTGERATPVIWCGSGASGVGAVLPRFWQEFPKAFEAQSGSLKIALFPSRCPDLHELQGGEQKTDSMYLDFAGSPNGLEWARAPLTAAPSPKAVQSAGVIADFPGTADDLNDIKPLVELFISGPEEFLRKREAVDEYGWRNFGELYADHEAVYHKGTEPFASHYNNQYDPCAGMYRRFLATGDLLWGELASDLARHVLDIDIYRTTGDREEYNNGMFWHTDHYVAAGLASHRSFSREQIGDRNPSFCGGGPGAQHCYTTGLMLYYFLSGDPAARDAVVDLAEWCYRSLCGAQTLLSSTINTRRYLSQLRSSDREHPSAFPRFPLTRGTGNTVSACVDAYEVSGNRAFLKRAEELIRGTLHPEDDLDARDLLNAELAWSYTVMLASVAKYLRKLEELAELGESYNYARGCLLAYAQWMAQHEYPYLEKPEILEYPNETWPAQDLRKSVIFYHAARHAEDKQRELFLGRGRFFFTAAKDELSRHKTCGLTRPLVLMLQNDWVEARLRDDCPVAPVSSNAGSYRGSPIPKLCLSAVTARIVTEFARALCQFSLRREIAWLRARL